WPTLPMRSRARAQHCARDCRLFSCPCDDPGGGAANSPDPGYNKPIAANPRRRSWSEARSSTAKILMQQAEQQMVLPDAVDAEIAPRQALAGEAAFLEHPDRRRIGGDAGGLH